MKDRISAFIDDVLARTPVVLVSRLDRGEVLRRLKAGVDSEWTFGGGNSVVGRVLDGGFRLRLRISYRNSFQTVMFGTAQADGRGTRIVARTGMHPFVAVFMAVWLSVVALAATISIAGVTQAQADEAQALFALIPAGMFAFGIALVGIGRWIARGERARLIEFLEDALDAKLVV